MYREPTVGEGNWNSNQQCGPEGKKETFNENRMKKQEFKTIEDRLGNLRTSLNIPTSES